MNKQELVRKIAADAEVTQWTASLVIDSAMEIIMNTVASGEKVQLSGFGNFEKKHRNARTTTHPTTGEKIEIPETSVPYFNPGAIFKEKVER